MTREEHLEWAKDRAIAYIDRGDLIGAVASLSSDLNKHQGTAGSHPPFLFIIGMGHARDGNAYALKHWIEGFN